MRLYVVALRLALAVLVGGLIGYERESRNRPAGFRTHILVCVGAAVTSIIQLYSIQETTRLILMNPGLETALKADIGRLGAQVITGVGFLGAGTIIHEKGSIKGLTTAASIWSVACIGLAAGLGYYDLTLLATACVFSVLVILKKFETRFIDRTKTIRLKVDQKSQGDSVQQAVQFFKENSFGIKNIDFSLKQQEQDSECMSMLYTLVVPKNADNDKMIENLCKQEGIVKAELM